MNKLFTDYDFDTGVEALASLFCDKVGVVPYNYYKKTKNEKEIVYELALPGLDKDDVEVTLRKGVFYITLKKECMTTHYKKFELPLIEDSDGSKALFKMKNGILVVTIPFKDFEETKIKID